MTSLRVRSGSLVLLCLVASCSLAPARRDAVMPVTYREVAEPSASTPPSRLEPRLLMDPPATTSMTRRAVGKDNNSYTIGKVGLFMPSGDIEDLDDGFAGELIFGRELLPFLAIEGSLGYLQADGDFGSVDLDLWAVPLFVNARASLPILFLEPYAGVGIGGMWVDYSAGSLDDDDIVAAYQLFAGVEVGIGNLAIGAEYKFLQSDETKDRFQVEGSIISLFVSLPF